LYAITKPEKPGELIRRLRAERVRQMRDAGYSKSEIADATGFSKSYVGRVK
jgi:DNA invertase Pin-like site-specific DNA recombinase